jgi:hypothetical protein
LEAGLSLTEKGVSVMNAAASRHRLKLSTLSSEAGIAIVATLLATALPAIGQSRTSSPASIAPPSSSTTFLVHSYLANNQQDVPTAHDLSGKCLDYASSDYGAQNQGQSVFLNDCAQSHPIVVEELNNGRHEVILHAGNKVIGVSLTSDNPPRNKTNSIANGSPLELFSPSLISPGSVDSTFALDGDSIILASSRCASTASGMCSPIPQQMVVQLQRGRSDNGTALVIAPRSLADSEFWDFIATDNSDTDPTSGFVRVTDTDSLLAAIAKAQQAAKQNGASWGSVIKVIDTGKAIDLTAYPAEVDYAGVFHNLAIPTGVTIRGDRRGLNNGPLLLGSYNDPNYLGGSRMMQVEGDYVRITGLRIQGPSGGQAKWPTTEGIVVGDPLLTGPRQPIETFIDHNELFDWPNEAVMPFAGDDNRLSCEGQKLISINNARIERNFLHHNAEEQLGYGVSVSHGAGATIFGNTFFYNRHAITSDATTGNQYLAEDNLVLSTVPLQCSFWICEAEQDFDVHGTQGPFGGQHDGGWAGDYAEVGWNTFLGKNRNNFTLRGLPCGGLDSFHNNVSQRTPANATKVWDFIGLSTQWSAEGELEILNNQFNSADPTIRLGIGDFDGDDHQDMFLATGATWFYSAWGVSEWRYLSGGKTDHIESLQFGDFDGDGRTDVLGVNGNQLMVSWGGISDWEVLNTLPAGASITDLAIGDFDGDHHSDILYANGKGWYISYGGTKDFTFAITSAYKVADLRFGHFAICGTRGETDVFAIESGKWHVSCGAVREWAPLPVSLTDSLLNLYIADFDGDGNADIANMYEFRNDKYGRLISQSWRISHNGAQEWKLHDVVPTKQCPALGSQIDPAHDPVVAGVGNFNGNIGSDILLWGGSLDAGNQFCIVSGGTSDLLLQSRSDMR